MLVQTFVVVLSTMLVQTFVVVLSMAAAADAQPDELCPTCHACSTCETGSFCGEMPACVDGYHCDCSSAYSEMSSCEAKGANGSYTCLEPCHAKHCIHLCSCVKDAEAPAAMDDVALLHSDALCPTCSACTVCDTNAHCGADAACAAGYHCDCSSAYDEMSTCEAVVDANGAKACLEPCHAKHCTNLCSCVQDADALVAAAVAPQSDDVCPSCHVCTACDTTSFCGAATACSDGYHCDCSSAYEQMSICETVVGANGTYTCLEPCHAKHCINLCSCVKDGALAFII
eukprot:TRINITY_DN7243_c0_g2_i1.p1 TRINITY_DN7243_c0_g2~~TRINITY_DN7243_c0_g2_i1.p1  ORF type:complete len:317 (-),score=49.14 TRINITY_DN7243_c0_g2_i1:229-1086(-)